MFRIICLLLAFPACTALAQPMADSLSGHHDYILDAATINAGVYRNFEEFKYNRPAIRDHYTVGKRRIWVTDAATGKTRKLRRDSVWGYSDGNHVMISHRQFREITLKGRYCYFEERGVRLMFIIGPYPPFVCPPIPVPYHHRLIVNFNNGNRYYLRKRLMKKILRHDDPELLAQFKKEHGKRQKLQQYVALYNTRNKGLIR